MLAFSLSHHMRLILSEIQSLTRMYLTSNTLVEICVRNLAVLVAVEFVEEELELCIAEVEAPVFEVEFELILLNEATLVLIEVNECFSDGLPLVLDLVQDNLLQGFVPLFPAPFRPFLLEVLLELGVLHWVMAKVETLTLMDGVAYPFRKVWITQLPSLAWVLVHY